MVMIIDIIILLMIIIIILLMIIIIIRELFVHRNLDLTAVLKCEAIRASVPVERLHRGDVAVPPEHVLAEHHVGQGRGQACGSLRGKVVVMFNLQF